MTQNHILIIEDNPGVAGSLREGLEREGYRVTWAATGTQGVARAYQAACTPDFFLFDENRELVYRGQFDDSRPGNDVPVTGEDLRAAADRALQGEPVPWRDHLLYEYFWERYAPHTPTMHALRGDRFKYIRPYGVWDLDELYDLEADPLETNNLILDPAYADVARDMNQQLFDILEATDGMEIPMRRDQTHRVLLRRRGGGEWADFPEVWLRDRHALE